MYLSYIFLLHLLHTPQRFLLDPRRYADIVAVLQGHDYSCKTDRVESHHVQLTDVRFGGGFGNYLRRAMGVMTSDVGQDISYYVPGSLDPTAWEKSLTRNYYHRERRGVALLLSSCLLLLVLSLDEVFVRHVQLFHDV